MTDEVTRNGRERGAAPILEAALALFRSRRPLDVSMREIAAAAGVAPSLLAYHFETRPQLLARACSLAGEAWREKLSGLTELAGRGESLEHRAEAAAAWLFALCADRPDLARLWGDLLLAADRAPALAEVAADWIAPWREAWASVAPTPLVAEFAAFELVFLPALAGSPERDLIVREALRRMLRRAAGEPVQPSDAHWHTQFCLDHMDPRPAPSERDLTVKNRIIDAAADIISETGTAGATHRAIATRAGASLSSMTYHFGSRAELIREGLLRVFERSMTSRPAGRVEAPDRGTFARDQQARGERDAAGRPGERLAMVRAIAEVALEAAVDPSFRPVATELRRIRGLVSRTALGLALGRPAEGVDAADYAIWESGAALMCDAQRAAGGATRAGRVAEAMALIFPAR